MSIIRVKFAFIDFDSKQQQKDNHIMELSEILDLKCVKVPLKAVEKYQAIAELIDLLSQADYIDNYQEVLKAVVEREAVRSTGVGQGFAIPHAKTDAIKKIVMAIGQTESPIDFESIDGQPVRMIILLISPSSQTGPHIQTLAKISRIMTDSEFRKEFWPNEEQKTTAQELYDYLIKQ